MISGPSHELRSAVEVIDHWKFTHPSTTKLADAMAKSIQYFADRFNKQRRTNENTNFNIGVPDGWLLPAQALLAAGWDSVKSEGMPGRIFRWTYNGTNQLSKPRGFDLRDPEKNIEYFVPDQLSVVGPSMVCDSNVHASTKEFSTFSDVQMEDATSSNDHFNFNVDGELDWLAGNAKAGFSQGGSKSQTEECKHQKQAAAGGKTEMVRTDTTAVVFSAILNKTSAKAALDPRFENDVKRLRQALEENDIAAVTLSQKFFDLYGTHFVKASKIGGEAFQDTFFTRKYSETHTSSALERSAEASFTHSVYAKYTSKFPEDPDPSKATPPTPIENAIATISKAWHDGRSGPQPEAPSKPETNKPSKRRNAIISAAVQGQPLTQKLLGGSIGGGASWGGGDSSSQSSTTASQEADSEEMQADEVIFRGGLPSDDYLSWCSSIKDNPALVKPQLEPIATLVIGEQGHAKCVEPYGHLQVGHSNIGDRCFGTWPYTYFCPKGCSKVPNSRAPFCATDDTAHKPSPKPCRASHNHAGFHWTFDGECTGKEHMMFEGNGDNGGSTREQAMRCANACKTLKAFKAAGFVVKKDNGRCFCEDKDSKTCVQQKNTAWARYDYGDDKDDLPGLLFLKDSRSGYCIVPRVSRDGGASIGTTVKIASYLEPDPTRSDAVAFPCSDNEGTLEAEFVGDDKKTFTLKHRKSGGCLRTHGDVKNGATIAFVVSSKPCNEDNNANYQFTVDDATGHFLLKSKKNPSLCMFLGEIKSEWKSCTSARATMFSASDALSNRGVLLEAGSTVMFYNPFQRRYLEVEHDSKASDATSRVISGQIQNIESPIPNVLQNHLFTVVRAGNDGGFGLWNPQSKRFLAMGVIKSKINTNETLYGYMYATVVVENPFAEGVISKEALFTDFTLTESSVALWNPYHTRYVGMIGNGELIAGKEHGKMLGPAFSPAFYARCKNGIITRSPKNKFHVGECCKEPCKNSKCGANTCSAIEDNKVPCMRPTTATNSKEYLNVTHPELYKGTQNVTRTGNPCDEWSKHPLGNTKDNTDIKNTNFCRMPTGDKADTIWCYTNIEIPLGNGKTRNWDYCEPKTEPVELIAGKGESYAGFQTETINGFRCQPWSSQSPHPHFVRKHFDDASGNYCRNPDGDKTIWCYTTDPNQRFDYCKPRSCAVGNWDPFSLKVMVMDRAPPIMTTSPADQTVASGLSTEARMRFEGLWKRRFWCNNRGHALLPLADKVGCLCDKDFFGGNCEYDGRDNCNEKRCNAKGICLTMGGCLCENGYRGTVCDNKENYLLRGKMAEKAAKEKAERDAKLGWFYGKVVSDDTDKARATAGDGKGGEPFSTIKDFEVGNLYRIASVEYTVAFNNAAQKHAVCYFNVTYDVVKEKEPSKPLKPLVWSKGTKGCTSGEASPFSEKVTIKENEYVVGITVRAGTVIDDILTIDTQLETHKLGVGEGEGGSTKTLKVKAANQRLVGFFGKMGSYMELIGIYSLQMNV
jgi:integrin beta 3